jgi:hypothetical protein
VAFVANRHTNAKQQLHVTEVRIFVFMCCTQRMKGNKSKQKTLWSYLILPPSHLPLGSRADRLCLLRLLERRQRASQFEAQRPPSVQFSSSHAIVVRSPKSGFK